MSTKETWNPVDECPVLNRLAGNFPTGAVWVANGERVLDQSFRSEVTTTGATVEPVRNYLALTTAGRANAHVVKNHFYCNTKFGNAAATYAYVDLGTGGYAWGQAAAVCAELVLGAAVNTRGSYFPLEIEFGYGTDAAPGRAAFMVLNVWGSAVGHFDDHGRLWDLNGVTIEAGHIVQTENDEAKFSHKVRVGINNTDYYLMLCAT